MPVCEVPKGLGRNSLFVSDSLRVDMSQYDVGGEVRLVD
jgi:hypothetical protein